jgi:arginine/lysine/ornithine decarboxylase
MASGADGAVTSPHKLLSGLSQAAMLHANAGAVDIPRLATAVRMTQTTSPLLPILASLDACRRQMTDHGEALLERTISLAGAARRRLQQLPGLVMVDADRLGLPSRRYDPTRLVVDVHHLGITGFEAEQMLRQQFGIAPEMSDLVSVVCLVTIGDTEESIDRLVRGFAAVTAAARPISPDAQPECRSIGEIIAPGVPVLSPRDAFFARSRAVPLATAVGEVVSELVVPYPPGIPVLAPGEMVTHLKVEYLRHIVARGGFVRGVADPSLATLRIVVEARDQDAP